MSTEPPVPTGTVTRLAIVWPARSTLIDDATSGGHTRGIDGHEARRGRTGDREVQHDGAGLRRARSARAKVNASTGVDTRRESLADSGVEDPVGAHRDVGRCAGRCCVDHCGRREMATLRHEDRCDGGSPRHTAMKHTH